jgi:hypothetical protein
MIIITLTTGFKLKYKGRISLKISSDDLSLFVSATSCDDNPNNLYTWDKQVFDMIWLSDIESIVGEYDRIRVSNDDLIAEQYFAPGLTLRKQEKFKK